MLLPDRQKAALRPFLREARRLDVEMGPNEHRKPPAYFEMVEWLALLYAFDELVP